MITMLDIDNSAEVSSYMQQNAILNAVVHINDVPTTYVYPMHEAMANPSCRGSLVLANTQLKQEAKGTINKKNAAVYSIGMGAYYLKVICSERLWVNVSLNGSNLTND
jgi:hypothetical protein